MDAVLLPYGPAEVAITVQSRAGLEAEVGRRLAAGQGFALATVNLDHIVKLRRDAAFRAAYAAHELITADGNPIVWLARLGGREVELLPGADLILPLCRLAAAHGAPVALVGATGQALAGAAARLRAEVPGLAVAAEIAPPMGFDPDGPAAEALLSEVVASGARIAFLALGAPKQEQLAALGLRLAPGVGFVSIGAGLDFLAGTQRRAPEWVRRLALEWLWRMLSNPRRLAGRYLASALVLPGLALRMWRRR
ncbi:WecB/TagA/CpsF family glycosyltransferase [Pseudoroseicyclus sp. CXY001]|uniref:WecB/TagA/CpsF family glycosyltransferase n=1 Tax=Pseudoroseicyclus sp. CXY001 TaxID=3242492 RepID=UPI0035715E5C